MFQLPSLATPVQTLGSKFEDRRKMFQLPSLATPLQTIHGGVENIFPWGFNCLHWRPRFKLYAGIINRLDELEVSIAFIGDPGSNNLSVIMKDITLFQLPSLATPVQT